MKFRKKPVVIEAVQNTRENRVELFRFMGEKIAVFNNAGSQGEDIAVMIPTLEGTMRAEPGDWVIRGVKGEIYPCKPDIFEATYEAVP